MENGVTKSRGIPPFLQKLVHVTEECPEVFGAWNAEGSQFVVTNSQFADVLGKHFRGSLQTFIRQLHFYSFQKKDAPNGTWTFSHPNFLRGRPDLLHLIERKPSTIVSSKKETDSPSSGAQPLEQRVAHIEQLFSTRLSNLEYQVNALVSLVHQQQQQPLQTFQPPLAAPTTMGLDAIHRQIEIEDAANKRFMQMEDSTSVSSDQLFNFDFPDEITSWISSSTDSNSSRLETPRDNSNVTVSVREDELATASECKMTIPPNFEFQPGVSPELVKSTSQVLQQICCQKNPLNSLHLMPIALKTAWFERPHPSKLPRVDLCPLAIGLLPLVRERISIEATDLQLMKAIHTCYELWYAKWTREQHKASGTCEYATQLNGCNEVGVKSSNPPSTKD